MAWDESPDEDLAPRPPEDAADIADGSAGVLEVGTQSNPDRIGSRAA